MSQSMTTERVPAWHAVPSAHTRLPARDRVTIGLLGFYLLVAVTLEAYWLLHHNEMEGRSDVFARLLQLYWPADRTYHLPGYGVDKAFTLAVESVNTVFTQWLQLWLIWTIVKRRHYRHILQLTVATYTFYGTFLYYYVAHLSSYAVFEERSTYAFLMFYGANAPWLLGYAWLMYDAIRALSARPAAPAQTSG